MRVRINANGFTIIETILFLAISSVFLLIAFIFIGPLARDTQFRVGVDRIVVALNDTVSDVESGYYGGGTTGFCNFNAGSYTFQSVSTTTAECTLLGRGISFDNNAKSLQKITLVAPATYVSIDSGVDVKTPINIPAEDIVPGYDIEVYEYPGDDNNSAAIIHKLLSYSGVARSSGLIINTDSDPKGADAVFPVSSTPEVFRFCVTDGSNKALITLGSAGKAEIRAQALYDAALGNC